MLIGVPMIKLKQASGIVLVVVLIAASAVAQPTQWKSVPAKVDGADTVIALKDAGDGHLQLEWSPKWTQYRFVALMMFVAKGPIQDGNIQAQSDWTFFNVSNDKPATLDYLKDWLKLKPGYYAIQIRTEIHTSDWFVFQIK
jgi:hypothetical protein